jgi:drug/metabolite transporter (DMT)-like permease
VALLEGETVVITAYPSHEILLFIAMAVGPGVIGHSGLNWVLEHVESNVVSVGFLGVPIVSTLLAVVLLNEIPGIPTAVGGVLVLVGIYITME